MPRLLLIEDDATNRDLIARRLQRSGYEMILAGNGLQGLEKARTELPDLILMDMSLPELDGWETTRRLKADAATRSIPIVGLSAHARKEDEEEARKAGCDDYLTKPIAFDILVAKIQVLLPGSGSAGS